MSKAMTECNQDKKERREAQVAARKESREARQAERNKKIADMIAG